MRGRAAPVRKRSGPSSIPLFPSRYKTKRSPPMPFIIGSTTPSTALTAIAESAADPPRARICAPACAARVWLAAAMPCCEITIDRPQLRPKGGCTPDTEHFLIEG